jgi:hypothetical protein
MVGLVWNVVYYVLCIVLYKSCEMIQISDAVSGGGQSHCSARRPPLCRQHISQSEYFGGARRQIVG